jgi:hypothetical protein
VIELFKRLAFPRSENMAEITEECWRFVIEQVLYVGSPIGSSTIGHFLTSLTDFISQEQPSSPKYLNVCGLISAYKYLMRLPGIIELPESGYKIEWYSSLVFNRVSFNYSQLCYVDVHPREITVCTGLESYNCCYDCARTWAGNQIDEGKYAHIYEDI